MTPVVLLALFAITAHSGAQKAGPPGIARENGYVTNSLGMSMSPIPAGAFEMGAPKGRWDERPAHAVTLSQPFLIAERSVTNGQYEQFDPAHRKFRRSQNGPSEDREAARFVSWDEANAFCKWLSAKEGKAYRLPTEAEWEFAASVHPAALADSAEVENWCLDWYGPYTDDSQTDPVGYADGDCRSVRGGVASESAKGRLSDLPQNRSRAVGFRVVQAGPPTGAPLTHRLVPTWAEDVSQTPSAWVPPVPANVPYFAEPIPYVHIPPHAHGPLYAKHNHDPGIAYCDNGDLLAVWYSTETEAGRELVVAASRLRHGQDSWDNADLFWDVAGRNDHAPAIWNDGHGTLYHFNGLSTGESWHDMVTVMRTSTDNGATWSPARIIAPVHEHGNQPIYGVFRRRDGAICLPCDAEPGPEGGTILHIGLDGGKTWVRSDNRRPPAPFVEGGVGPRIAGIHAAVDQWTDGSIVALGRGNDIEGRMPMSVSTDGGLNWTYSASPFPPISTGQRAVLRTLREGALLLVSFTLGSTFVDSQGGSFEGKGMFAALSYDGGKTWPVRKLLTDGVRRTLDGRGWTHEFTMDANHAEPMGYLAAVQTPDGTVHLFSSGVHYRFNLAWLEQPNVSP
jgi:sulfatase modifying factor 1